MAGGSSGAYQALEWGIVYPGFARSLILYAGAFEFVSSATRAFLATLK